MKKITADLIYPINTIPLSKKVVILDDQGKILEIGDLADHDPITVEQFKGIICPGFVNTHCHLELSHMKGLVPTGTGLIEFIASVVKFRDFPQEQIDNAIRQADSEMFQNGIQAVGDICNKLDTALTKNDSLIHYYSFVEYFDFIAQNNTENCIAEYDPVFDGQSEMGLNKKSRVPHAPYSVSKSLFAYLKNNNQAQSTISIHNQETFDENLFFTDKKGKFLDFYTGFGMQLDGFEKYGKTAIYYALENMDPLQKTLFVHNTMTSEEDIKAAHDWSKMVYWATCPNANLYIENRLPNYKNFMNQNAKMTIGTDSLTSNWQLSIWEELKTIHKYQSHLDFDELIRWATINGAEALGYDDTIGSIEIGKSPGLVNIEIDLDELNNNLSNSHVKRII